MEDTRHASADAEEVARFAAQADAWWDETGEFRPLHAINPVRLAFIRDQLCGHFGRDPKSLKSLDGLRLIDIGCGGGLLCEPLARLGARVTGIDAAAEAIAVARAHADAVGLDIDYRAAAPEALAAAGERFDAVLNMEVIEHVADREAFMAACGALVRPGGAMVLATLNRTLKSLALGKVAAEYLLGWVAPGTHDWRKFVKPSELGRLLRAEGFELGALRGLAYDPATGDWRLDRDVDVNYLMFAAKG